MDEKIRVEIAADDFNMDQIIQEAAEAGIDVAPKRVQVGAAFGQKPVLHYEDGALWFDPADVPAGQHQTLIEIIQRSEHDQTLPEAIRQEILSYHGKKPACLSDLIMMQGHLTLNDKDELVFDLEGKF